MAYKDDDTNRRVGLHATACSNLCTAQQDHRGHWNGKRIEPPAWLARLDAAARSTKGPCAPCVVVAHPARDYGPATKLVGAVSDWRGK